MRTIEEVEADMVECRTHIKEAWAAHAKTYPYDGPLSPTPPGSLDASREIGRKFGDPYEVLHWELYELLDARDEAAGIRLRTREELNKEATEASRTLHELVIDWFDEDEKDAFFACNERYLALLQEVERADRRETLAEKEAARAEV